MSKQTSPGDGTAVGKGAAVGFLTGIGLGALFVVAIGEMPLWQTVMIVWHTGVAVAVMGAWTMPCMSPHRDHEPLVRPIPMDELSRSKARSNP